jgi:hypothetical protein
MLGWHVSIYTLVARKTSAAPTPRDRRGDRIAVWQAGIAGLRWIDELVESGAAIAESTNGYPSVFYAKAADVVPRLDAPPDAHQIWVSGPHDVLTDKWDGKTVVDRHAAANCRPDEWLLIEAWDES